MDAEQRMEEILEKNRVLDADPVGVMRLNGDNYLFLDDNSEKENAVVIPLSNGQARKLRGYLDGVVQSQSAEQWER